MENSAQGLRMLEPEHKVVVTGEEHHQAALAPWAPRPGGPARRVAAELDNVAGTRGRRVIEVRLDGRRVGTLTALMSERYAPHVQEVLRRRERPGCVAMVVHGRRGLVEMELHLPDVDGIPAPPAAGPRPAPHGPDGGRPSARPRRRVRTPLMIGGGVFALLLVIGAVTGGGAEPDPGAVPVVAAAAPSSRPAPTTIRVTPTPTPTPTVEDVDVDVAAAAPAPVRPVEVTRAPAPRQATAEPRREPAPQPAPEPEPQRAAAAPAGGGCHPSYSPCVPDGPDLDCGDLDGPYAVSGPDEFRLDADDDGVGCE